MAEEITVVLKGRDETLGSTLSGAEKDLGGVAEAANKLSKESEHLDDNLKKTESSAGKLASGLGGVAQVAGGFVVGQALIKGPGLMMDMANQAANLELQQKKVNTVFGDSTGIVTQWANENAKSMGLTTTQASTLAAGLGDLLVPMGMTRDAAADMATKTIGLSGALAEWSGGTKSATEVADILTKAYLGETDGLKSLGIAISAADVDAALLAKGQKDLTGEALAQAKALAIQEMVFAKSTDAQNAFANGAGTAARKQAEMRASMAQAKEELAMALAPAITQVTLLLSEAAVPAFRGVGVAIGLIGSAAGQLGPVLDALKPIFGFLADNMDIIGPAIGAVAATILASMIPAAYAWAAAEAVKAAALIASAAAFLLANAPLIAIAAGVGLLVAGIILLVKHWDEITQKVPALGAALNGAKAAFSAFKDGVSAAIDFVMANWPLIAAIIAGPFAPLVLLATDMFGVRSKLEDSFTFVKNFVKGNWPEIAAIISGPFFPLVALATDAFGVRSALEDAFRASKNFVGDQISAMAGFITALPGALSGVVGALKSAATDLGTAIIDGVADGVKGIGQALSGFGGDLKDAIRRGINEAMRWAHENIKIEVPGISVAGKTVVPGFTWAFPMLQFAGGGFVPGSGVGDVIPALLTPGEFVLTRQQTQSLMGRGSISAISQNGHGGDTYHVHLNMPNYLGSKTEVAREIMRELRRGGLAIS